MSNKLAADYAKKYNEAIKEFSALGKDELNSAYQVEVERLKRLIDEQTSKPVLNLSDKDQYAAVMFMNYRLNLFALIKRLEAIKDEKTCSMAEKLMIIRETADMLEGKLPVAEYMQLARHVQGKGNPELNHLAGCMIVSSLVAYTVALVLFLSLLATSPDLALGFFSAGMASFAALYFSGMIAMASSDAIGNSRVVSHLAHSTVSCRTYAEKHNLFKPINVSKHKPAPKPSTSPSPLKGGSSSDGL